MRSKKLKPKEPVKLRFKELQHGNKSLYLEYYVSGQRKYEFLKLYLIPETDREAKELNEHTLMAATAIKSRRIIELTNNRAGICQKKLKPDIPFSELIAIYKADRQGKCAERTIDRISNFERALSKFETRLKVSEIDQDYCRRLVQYLKEKPNARYADKGERTISANTVRNYFSVFCAIMNFAARKDMIERNPATQLEACDRPPKSEKQRCFLTIDELHRLMETPHPNKGVCDTFLFSCFCGLRYSDIMNLRWKDLEQNSGRFYANIIIQKTRNSLYLPLNKQAISYIPKRPEHAHDNDKVFQRISPNTMCRQLAAWAQKAGISKHITFHTARHTFATTSLTLGADLYTTSKLLGHSNITTTQIYARIVNEKKDKAMELFDKAF